jgi:predicted transcriptional regulator
MSWDAKSAAKAVAMRKRGLRIAEIAEAVGRSPSAVKSMLERRGIYQPARVANALRRETWANKEEKDGRDELILSSNALRDATTFSIARFAATNGLSDIEAKSILLGGQTKPAIPGTERILKTCAIERMAA